MRYVKLAIALCIVTTGAFAAPHDMHGHAVSEKETASTTAYRAAMQTMHEGMDITYTGDADADFVKGMIPHHEGAVKMAEIEVKYGKDPELRKLASDIVAAQEKEIRFMKKWHDTHAAH